MEGLNLGKHLIWERIRRLQQANVELRERIARLELLAMRDRSLREQLEAGPRTPLADIIGVDASDWPTGY